MSAPETGHGLDEQGTTGGANAHHDSSTHASSDDGLPPPSYYPPRSQALEQQYPADEGDFGADYDDGETGWDLPEPVDSPLLRFLCAPIAWCAKPCSRGSVYGCTY
ncbi:unnamed protein product [Parajaminaea phylloscopi]